MKRLVLVVALLIMSLPFVALAGHTAGGKLCNPPDGVTCFEGDPPGGNGNRVTQAPTADSSPLALLVAVMLAAYFGIKR